MYINQTADIICLLVTSTSSIDYDVMMQLVSSKGTLYAPPCLSNLAVMDPSNKSKGSSPHYSLYQRHVFKTGETQGLFPAFPSTHTSSQNQQRIN
ncbi:hypothetical protein HYPSUDRAFT_268295 [Hypholoma sublateritium FD-334 SS-4]|uniref:Uncharacterized protein n=1 Tax=Hypholoma sublateritium (strain FD-334 SS-4) TaxID=945553 RepID=A0A0D2LQ27_HYPSF|nr:hypothetical protein HYPSUDRAFT_268295 [Hypholoma sublateritium FD-334 SS-4]